jgi:hypothetical protein
MSALSYVRFGMSSYAEDSEPPALTSLDLTFPSKREDEFLVKY